MILIITNKSKTEIKGERERMTPDFTWKIYWEIKNQEFTVNPSNWACRHCGLMWGSTLAPWATCEQCKVQRVGWTPRNGVQATGAHGQQQHIGMLAQQHAKTHTHVQARCLHVAQPVGQQHGDCGNVDGMPQTKKQRCSRDEHSLSSKGLDAWAQHAQMQHHMSHVQADLS